MRFVIIHAVVFGLWIVLNTGLLGLPRYDPSLVILAMVASVEAIFLSTFVMIGQNRQAAFQQAKADHDYAEEGMMLKENTDITKTIHQLTEELHAHVLGTPSASSTDATS